MGLVELKSMDDVTAKRFGERNKDKLLDVMLAAQNLSSTLWITLAESRGYFVRR